MGSLSVLESPWNKLPPSPLSPFQHKQANRSPVDSPPVAKKHLRVEGPNGDMIGPTRRRRDPSATGIREAEKENRSILKRRSGVGNSPNPDPAISRSPPRHVDFQNSVLVFHFDRLEGDHVCSESQRLSVDAKDRKQFLMRSMHENRQRCLATSEPVASSSYQKSTFHIPFIDETDSNTSSRTEQSPSRGTTSRSTSSSEQRPLPCLPSTVPDVAAASTTPDFSFYEDSERHLRIKFMVPLGSGVAANDVLVKANMTGNKVRVLATRTISTPGTRGRVTTVRQEFSERYQLPMEVDPYKITARMDSIGNLFVEAPVLTVERKKTLERDRQKKSESGFTL